MLQKAAGCRIEPPVSVPSAPKARSALTAAADPPEDPEGIRSTAHGLRTGPKAEFSFEEPMANSSQLVLPMMTPPDASIRWTAVASYGGTKFSSSREPQVVPRVRFRIYDHG